MICSITVEVSPGCELLRHGKVWKAGERLNLTPGDANRLVRRGIVRRA